jgi:MSHA biogenesis protein MshG
MPSFAYTGRDRGGALVEGMMESVSPSALADQLAGRGITPLRIRAAAADPAKPMAIRLPKLGRRPIRSEEVMLLSRQLYTLLKAGVPIMRALAGLRESAANPQLSRVIRDVQESLDGGRELSASFARHPSVFSAFYLSMVRVGELTGRLEEIFLRLFEHLDFERFMRDQVRSALRYPSFVIATMALALVIVNIWVIPAFAKVYQGFKAELPWMTKILIGFSNFMVGSWPILLGAAIGAALAFRWWVGTPGGRLRWHQLQMKIPIAGKIVHKATLARFARSFALAARSGVPVVQALSVVSQTVDNDYIAQQVLGMREGVERGESVLRAAIGAEVFTPVVLQMVAVGEESGALDDMMEEIAQMYQREVEYELKTLSSQIEPILIVCLGVLVLVLALGVFLPVWDLGQAAMHKSQ